MTTYRIEITLSSDSRLPDDIRDEVRHILRALNDKLSYWEPAPATFHPLHARDGDKAGYILVKGS